MELRTNPKAPFVDKQPSQVLDMSYMPPAISAAVESQKGSQNIRRDCNGGVCESANPLAGGVAFKNLPPRRSKSAKLDNSHLDKSKADKLQPKHGYSAMPKLENIPKSSQPVSAHIEKNQRTDRNLNFMRPQTSGDEVESSPWLPKFSKEKLVGQKPPENSDLTKRGSQAENRKAYWSHPTSSQDLVHCSPESLQNERTSKQVAHSKKVTGSMYDKKVNANNSPSLQPAVVEKNTGEREISEQDIIDSESMIGRSSTSKTPKKSITTNIHELSYFHDFTDCLMDNNILDYCEKEEQQSQASKPPAPVNSSCTTPPSAKFSSNPKQHALDDCPKKSTGTKPKLAGAEPHTLNECVEEKASSNAKSTDPKARAFASIEKDDSSRASSADPQSHALADDLIEIYRSRKAKSDSLQTHTLSKDPEVKDETANPAGLQLHALTECLIEKDKSCKPSFTNPQTHILADDPLVKGNLAKPAGSQPHVLAECPEVDTTSMVTPGHLQSLSLAGETRIRKASFDPSQPQALVECDAIKIISNGKPSDSRSHPLVECYHESVKNSPTEQHALAECRGDGRTKTRRASSDQGSPTAIRAHVMQHRLASCPVPLIRKKDSNAEITHHVPRNVRGNGMGERQSMVKFSSQHTLSDCVSGTKVEGETAAIEHQAFAGRLASLSSLDDLPKGKHEPIDLHQKSIHRQGAENATNTNEAKRTSHAQQSLSQILEGRGSKKDTSLDDSLESIIGAVHSIGNIIKKRSDDIGDAFRKQTQKVAQDLRKGL